MKERGFTLIETMIATAVSVVAFGLLFWGLAHSWKLWNNFRGQAVLERDAERVVAALRSDLAETPIRVPSEEIDVVDGEVLRLRLQSGEEIRYRRLGTSLLRNGAAVVVSSCAISQDGDGKDATWLRLRVRTIRGSRSVERLLVRWCPVAAP